VNGGRGNTVALYATRHKPEGSKGTREGCAAVHLCDLPQVIHILYVSIPSVLRIPYEFTILHAHLPDCPATVQSQFCYRFPWWTADD